MEQRAIQLENLSQQLINRCQQLENTVFSLRKSIVENESLHKTELEKFTQQMVN